jgi:hypothetical protein
MSDYPFIEQGGHRRLFSLKPRTMEVGDPRCCKAVCGRDGGPIIIPRKDWPKCIDFSEHTSPIRDQNGHNLCWAEGSTGAAEDAHLLAGRKCPRLSMGSMVYRTNGGQDEGAGVDEAMETLMKFGQVPQSMIDDNNFSGRHYPKGWEDEALKYRIWPNDCGHDQTFDAAISRIIEREPVALGTNAWGGGHLVRAFGYFIGHNDTVYMIGANSWGNWTNWTDQSLEALAAANPNSDHSLLLKTKGVGYWVWSERQVSNGLGMFGAFGVGATTASDEDDPVPVVS